MRRRSRASSKLANTRSRKAKTLKAARHTSSASGKETEVERLRRELRKAQEQQSATAEVLKIISTSPTELQPVLEVLVRSAARFCEADDVTIFELDGQYLRIAAHWGTVPQEIGIRFPCVRGSVAGRTVLERKPFHVLDLQAEAEEFPEGSAFARRLGHRTMAGVPLLREGVAVGTIQLRRAEVNPFTDKQITLLETFAAQAVIAIENTRLLNELRESLDRQTATADILRVIAGTPEDSKRALDTIAETASRMFDAANVNLRRLDGNVLRIVGSAGPTVARLREALPDLPLAPTDPAVRSFFDNRQISVEDRHASLPNERGELARALRDLPIRSQAFTPLSREGKAIGVMIVSRGEVQPFQEHELELMKGFADQAVIAIENARLLNELRQSLEQQTATSDVLRVISSSPGELEPVFDAVLENATRVCDAKFGMLYRCQGDRFHLEASYNAPSALIEHQSKRGWFEPRIGAPLNHLLQTREVVHGNAPGVDPSEMPSVRLGGAQSSLTVPMFKDTELVGAIFIYRQEKRPFTEKHVALVTNFAAQAVIAIENARLLNELRQRTTDLTESLEQQTATSEVLRVISSSPGDLTPVFEAMLTNAVRICDAKFGVMFRFDNEAFNLAALFGVPPALADFLEQRGSFQPHAGTNLERMWRTKGVVRIVDDSVEHVVSPASELGGARSLIDVPMLKENVLIGAIIIYRQEVRPFTDKQIALVQNFAAQAVIAIENARLLNELRQRTADLTDSLEQQTATSEVLKVISSSPGDLEPVFEAMLANATRLCEAKFGVLQLCESGGFRVGTTHNAPPAFVQGLAHRELIFRPTPPTSPSARCCDQTGRPGLRSGRG